MGIAHHSHYLVWCEDARTAYLRESGISYRDLEERGLLLVVVEAGVRFRAAARYDDVIRIDCWIRDRNRRRIVFGYAIMNDADGRCLATAHTALMALDSGHARSSVPPGVLEQLVPVVDPVRL
jgi:acyl-CoA thioester hydrolase